MPVNQWVTTRWVSDRVKGLNLVLVSHALIGLWRTHKLLEKSPKPDRKGHKELEWRRKL